MINSRFLYKVASALVIFAIVISVLLRYFPELIPIRSNESTATAYESMVFDKQKVMSIDLIVNENEWNDLLQNATKKEYIACDIVINGEKFKNVGIRAKGNTSLSSVASDDTTDRYSFKVEFDHYINQTCYGLDKLALNNIIQDNTYMKEYMAYDLFNYMGVPSSLYSFANVSVNGKSWGLYLALEALEESYAIRNFGSTYGNLYKPESMKAGMDGMMKTDRIQVKNTEQKMPDPPQQMEGKEASPGNPKMEGKSPASEENMQQMQMGGGRFGSLNGCDLVYNGDDLDSYSAIWDGAVFDTDNKDHKRVVEALQKINEGDLEDALDVDMMLRYTAVNSMIVNYDSYFGNLCHNYYLYEKDGKLAMLPWDHNLAFAGFQMKDAKSAVNDPIDEPVSGTTLAERPLIGQVLAVEENLNQYHSYLNQLVEEYFNSGRWEQTIQQVDALIGEYVKHDPTAFCTYEEYQKAVETLKKFGLLRAESISRQLSGVTGSTADQQKLDQDALVNADEINLSDMGTQGGEPMGDMPSPERGTPQEGMMPPDGFASPQGMPPKNDEIHQEDAENAQPVMSQQWEKRQESVNLYAVVIHLVCVIAAILALLCVMFYSRRKYYRNT